jgi:hydroxymethylbilane synthase
MCPAVGQGALGIEARADDLVTLKALSYLEDPWARLTVTAERALLRGLGGGCQIPIASTVSHEGEQMRLTALVIRPDGQEFIKESLLSESISGLERSKAIMAAEVLGKKAAAALLDKGAARLLGN